MIAALSLMLALRDDWISPKTNAQLLDDLVAMKEDDVFGLFGDGSFDFRADRYEGHWALQYVPKKGNPSSMELLVARGADAVPYLASQLSSTQPTVVTFGSSPFSSVWLSDLYDPRVREVGVDEIYPDADASEADGAVFKEHTFCRGDIAYLALGQIVNRWYGRFSAQNTAIGSPPKHPKLLRRAQAEWGSLTREDLRQVLRTDMLKPDSDERMSNALCRYRTYFPEDAVRMAVECLKTSYGKWAPGDRSPDWFFIDQLKPIACEEIDKVCYDILTKTLKQNHFIIDYEDCKGYILSYLKDRPGYREKCFAFARKHENEKTREGYDCKDFLMKNRQ